ncbi:MAG: prepilin peptidase [Tepidiformaceae bacterium]
MEFLRVAAFAALGLAGGLAIVRWQHLLYRDQEHRRERLRGGRLRLYQLIGGVAGAAIAALALRPGHYDAGPAAITAIFGFVLLTLSTTDFERRIIPDRLSYPAILLAAALCWAWPDRSAAAIFGGAAFAVGVAALLFGAGLAVGAVLRIRGVPFGLGDVKLIVLIGLLTGWPAVASALLIGVVVAGLPSLALMVSGRSRAVFAYGPYLAAGGLVVLLFPANFV